MSNNLQALKNTPFLLRTITAILAVCILIAACDTQNNIVNPAPAGNWRIAISKNPGSAQNYFFAVAATSTNDAWAVGSYSNNHFDIQGAKALIEHWNGSAWSVVSSPNAPLGNSILNGVAAISLTNAWAVGYTFSDSNTDQQTLIEHWNGASWTIVKSPNPANGNQLSAITALSATDIWAVGTYGNNPGQTLIEQAFIVHWDGKVWKEVQSPNPGSGFNSLTGLAAVSTNDIWAVGSFSNGKTVTGMQETLIEHWNGTSWTVIQSVNPGAIGNMLSTVAAVSTNDVWVVGNSGNNSPMEDTLIEHWNGKSWSTVEGQNPGKATNTLSAIVALSAHNVWAVGSSSSAFASQQAQPLIEHWNGTSWSTVASPNIGTNNTNLDGAELVPHSTKIWAIGTGATYGTPITVPLPNTNLTTTETPVTAQTLIESCCS